MQPRRGFSLIELTVVVAILAALLGIILGGVQKVRVRAVQLRSENNLRQIVLGLHGYAAAKQGRLPGVRDPMVHGSEDAIPVDHEALHAIVGYIEGEPPTPRVLDVLRPDGSVDSDRLNPRRKVYISPADPSIPIWDTSYTESITAVPNPPARCPDPPTSYAENMMAFVGLPTLVASFSDGTAATIAFAERYAIGFRDTRQGRMMNRFSYPMAGPAGPVFGPRLPEPNLDGVRRSTFADRGWRDVYPVTKDKVSRASVAGRTFQVRPTVEEADATVLQTPFAAGLPVAMFDGSVRTISPRVSEVAFWAAVTPNGGETMPLD